MNYFKYKFNYELGEVHFIVLGTLFSFQVYFNYKLLIIFNFGAYCKERHQLEHCQTDKEIRNSMSNFNANLIATRPNLYKINRKSKIITIVREFYRMYGDFLFLKMVFTQPVF